MTTPHQDSARTVPPPPSLPETVEPRDLRRALVHALWAASLAAWITCPPRYLGLIRSVPSKYLHLFWWTPSILIALEYVVMVLVAALCGAAASYRPRLHWSHAEVRRNVLSATSVAIWMAPLMILFLERSALTGLVAAGMVISAFALLGIAAREDTARLAFSTPESAHACRIFHISDLRPFARRLAMAIAASGLLQAALLANFIAEREFAVLFFVAGAALLAVQLPAKEEVTRKRKFLASSRSRVLLSTTMATVVVVFGLLPFLMSAGHRERSFDALLRNLFVKTVPVTGAHQSVRVQQPPIRSDGYIGVILTPKQKKRVEPKVPRITVATRTGGLLHPLTIRFTGSYWFFQSPFLGPPMDSVTAEGDPATIGVRSSNYKPLLMEAVQDLDEPIDTASLENIQLSMLDTDPYPGTVSVELVLVDTKLENHLQSLGVQRLNAIPVVKNANSSHSDTLTYSVPWYCRCKEFNQIRLIFRLDPSRSKQGAAIAIQSFMLGPRGT